MSNFVKPNPKGLFIPNSLIILILKPLSVKLSKNCLTYQVIFMKNTSQKIIKDLYRQEYKIYFPDDKKTGMPEAGSLGLLALGYKGLIAWRKSRSAEYEAIKAENITKENE